MARNDARENTSGIRIAGTVARTMTSKGFGFITGEDKKEYFFHLSNCGVGVWEEICRQPKDGAGVPVSFEKAQTAKGLRALAVML